MVTSEPPSSEPRTGERSDLAQISGQYFANAKIQKVKNAYNTQENRKLLWALSMGAYQRALPG